HAAHYLATAIQAGQGLEGPEQRAWLDRLNAEHANLLLALSWFDQQGDAASLRRMVWSLFFFWWYEGYIAEARSWYDRALAQPIDPADPINAWISFAASILASNVHAFDQAEALARQAMELARTSGNDSAEAMAMTVISYSKISFDDLTEAARVAGEDVAMLRYKTDGFCLGTMLAEHGVT